MLETILGILLLNIAFAIATSFGLGIIGLLYFRHQFVIFQNRAYKIWIVSFILTFTFTLTTLFWFSLMCWTMVGGVLCLGGY